MRGGLAGGWLSLYVCVCVLVLYVCAGRVSHLSVSRALVGEGRVVSLSWRDKAGRQRAAAGHTEPEDD